MSAFHGDHRVEAVILAAGQGTRMGQVKPLVRLEGATLLEWVSGAITRAEVAARVTVVIGAHAEKVGEEARRLGLKTIENLEHEEGMMSSLQAAVREAIIRERESGVHCDAVLVALADQPLVQPRTLRDLCEAYFGGHSGRVSLARPVLDGRPGHPCLIGRKHFDEILAQPAGDRGAAFLFTQHPSRVLLLPVCDPGILVDFDTPSDLVNLRSPHAAAR